MHVQQSLESGVSVGRVVLLAFSSQKAQLPVNHGVFTFKAKLEKVCQHDSKSIHVKGLSSLVLLPRIVFAYETLGRDTGV